jgi:hypothetical protein
MARGQTPLGTSIVRCEAYHGTLSAELNRWEARDSRRQLWERLGRLGCNETEREPCQLYHFLQPWRACEPIPMSVRPHLWRK